MTKTPTETELQSAIDILSQSDGHGQIVADWLKAAKREIAHNAERAAKRIYIDEREPTNRDEFLHPDDPRATR